MLRHDEEFLAHLHERDREVIAASGAPSGDMQDERCPVEQTVRR
jgi:hypothetical protein